MASGKLEHCSAEFFAETWKEFDKDGNGYIEGAELQPFLEHLARKLKLPATDVKQFMAKYDKNKDGRIDMKELVAILNTEEGFLCLIRTECAENAPNSVEFKKIWTKYDTDGSGYIESGELKNFLRDAYATSGKPLDEDKLAEYTKAALELYDKDGNHKLDFTEMIKLLPLATNYLKNIQFDKLTEKDFDDIFRHYDRNHDNSIEDRELDKLLGDLLRKEGLEATSKTISERKKTLMTHCDKNKDGKIQRSELKFIFHFSSK